MALENTKIAEGSAVLLIPKKCLVDPHHCEVFYNPAMQFNRSLSALFLETCLEYSGIEKPFLFDGFTGTGIRGIRYLKESGVAKVVFCDAGDATISYIKKNIALNKVKKSAATVMHMDVNQGLSNSPVFDVVELDPFGSPLPSLDSAFRRGKKKFILSLTFTDLANLCGGHKDACNRYYNAKSIHCAFSHELAMRIILARVARTASMYDFGVTPLVSWYEGHYIKIILLCENGAIKADKNFENVGYAWLCSKCASRGLTVQQNHLCACGSTVKFAGPLWIKPFSKKELISLTIKKLAKSKVYSEKEASELNKFLSLLLEENETPLFYSLTEFCSKLKVNVPKIADFVEKLKQNNFEATRTHFSPDCFKTNASVEEILKLL
ncbi:MAG: tRNA (guanine(10)-N(2))-dimethyltransferase [Candidatus Micrarchaeota archaeon]